MSVSVTYAASDSCMKLLSFQWQIVKSLGKKQQDTRIMSYGLYEVLIFVRRVQK